MLPYCYKDFENNFSMLYTQQALCNEYFEKLPLRTSMSVIYYQLCHGIWSSITVD